MHSSVPVPTPRDKKTLAASDMLCSHTFHFTMKGMHSTLRSPSKALKVCVALIIQLLHISFVLSKWWMSLMLIQCKSIAIMFCTQSSLDVPRVFMTKVNDGQISIKAAVWPSFMYDLDEFDERCAEKGLCRGYFLVQVCIKFCISNSILIFGRFSSISLWDPHRPFQRFLKLQNHPRLNFMVLPRLLGSQLLMLWFKCISHFSTSSHLYLSVVGLFYALHS